MKLATVSQITPRLKVAVAAAVVAPLSLAGCSGGFGGEKGETLAEPQTVESESASSAESSTETDSSTSSSSSTTSSSESSTSRNDEESAGFDSDAEMMEISSGPLTIKVPKDWEKLDKDDDVIKDPWVVGAHRVDPMVQIRITSDTGQAPYADATNQVALYGNIFAQDNQIEPRGSDDVDVEGADEAQIAYFEYIDDDGDAWDGLFMSAANRETGNVSTLEMMSLRDMGLSQDEALEIVHTARYDKSKENFDPTRLR